MKNIHINMNKKLIRLTESDLHRIVKRSVNKVLNEISIDTAIAAHKAAQGDLDWDEFDDSDEKYKRERQADTFANYAQDKGAKYYPYGLIGWYQNDSDGVFDRSEVVCSENIDDIPDDGYGIYALTREGKDVYEQWKEDASAGYDLGYGRMKGLAREIGGGEWNIWEYLTSHKHLSRKIKY